MYSVRRIKDAFKENKNISDPQEISQLIEYGKRNLAIIKRQVCLYCLIFNIELKFFDYDSSNNCHFFQATIGDLYSTDKLVIEK